MFSEISTEDAKALMRGMVIPPRPDILLALEDAQHSEAPDFAEIARLISADMVLSGAVIKTVNSPFFSLSTRVNSVQQALQLLGLKNLANIVQGLVLRQVLSPASLGDMSEFWDYSSSVAMAAAYLAEAVHGVSSDEAYTLGLFLNCGKPLMALRFPGYTLQHAVDDHCTNKALIFREEQQYRVSHNVVGYLLARAWYLPVASSLAILHLHDGDISERAVQWPHVCALIALAQLAEHIVQRSLHLPEQEGWPQAEVLLRGLLGLSQDELEDLQDSVQQKLNH
ncbi:HDOD domain-containing protein [Iodobacter sp. LRB]|uniref:HDOD domain-containing protein n=1 Tax=unclassified Iodobacter TaxID=235634 RepID=UPI000C10C414|nr:HDOD domain-containing protein [Iodobacter sp. BJB302]PHV01614.1 hypothetical protein CSQ88_11325 [Iodobacter sp. BJB302]